MFPFYSFCITFHLLLLLQLALQPFWNPRHKSPLFEIPTIMCFPTRLINREVHFKSLGLPSDCILLQIVLQVFFCSLASGLFWKYCFFTILPHCHYHPRFLFSPQRITRKIYFSLSPSGENVGAEKNSSFPFKQGKYKIRKWDSL